MLKSEHDVLNFWEENKIFEKTLENNKNKEPFVFLDGPPFASGLPHWGHIFISQVKDTMLRYQTQKGKYVPRRWGWDCHGVPIEAIVEKVFDVKDKRQIENEIGVDRFNEECRNRIFAYDQEWRKVIHRIGRWVDMDDQYRTLDNDFIESVWWGLGQLWNRNLIHKDYRISLYSPSMGVPLSHTDVAMEVVYENETIDSPIVRFLVKPDSAKKLTKKILEQVAFSYSEQQRYKLDVEKRIQLMEKTDSKLRRNKLQESFKGGKPEFAGIEWENFKSNVEDGKELTYLLEQKEVVLQNVETLENIKTILSRDYDFNLLAWTTTPWTLAANTALVVGGDIEYSLYFLPASSELVVMAESRAIETLSLQFANLKSKEVEKELSKIEDSGEYFEKLGAGITKVVSLDGKDLQGLEYYPIFENTQDVDNVEQRANVHKVYTAGIVSDEEGTGIIHIAPYGPEDFDVIKERNLPVLLCLNDHGEMLSDRLSKDLKPVFGKKYSGANPLINQILEKKGSLFHTLKHKHRVPIFERDGKKVYYAPQEGWYIAETKLKSKSLELNKEVNWVPNSLKYGRFGNGLETAPDWSISRNRYWGSPVPIWENDDKTKLIFADSIEKLIRHAVNPIFCILNSRNFDPELYEGGQTVILTDSQSKLPLGITATQYRSKPLTDLRKEKELSIQRFAIYAQRILDETLDLFEKYSVVQLMLDDEEQRLWTTWLLTLHPGSKKSSETFYFYRAVKQDLDEWIPTGPIKMLDLHKPFIDEIILKDQVDNIYTRVPEVLDTWVDSGSMPWASMHYPFENKDFVEKNIPADWIIEAQDQTRGWFRVLHVLSGGIFGKEAFKNVNVSGLILAADGKKMSKKKQNYSDPMEMIEKYGSDALRAYLLSSTLLSADSLAFKDKDLETVFKGTTLLISNSIKYIEFVSSQYSTQREKELKHPLNKWWMEYTKQTMRKADKLLSEFKMNEAARLLEPYLQDFSTWYIRRSKDILKDSGEEVLKVLKDSLKLFAITFASIQPFNAEKIWSIVRSEKDLESVHLTQIPNFEKEKEVNDGILYNMEKLRVLVSEIHSVRKQNNLRVRQPIYADFSGMKLEAGLMEILKLECNLLTKDLSKTEGEIWENVSLFGRLKIDLVVDKDLAVMGLMRDSQRAIQQFRKKEGFKPNQIVSMKWQAMEVEDDEIFERVINELNFNKLFINVTWVKEELDDKLDKKIEIKGLGIILVDDIK